MKIKLVTIGKTDSKQLSQLIDLYKKRLSHYIRFEFETIPDLKNTKNMSEAQQKEKEGELLISSLQKADRVILLDEKGKSFTSEGFAEQLQKIMNAGTRELAFVIGGPYGFSDAVYARADQKISLSQMTLSHQMVRLFFTEQLYRAFTILKNEPYHHR
ncbi:23S rRNA (pseudouridine(1915)-N(3))-methyltransferase RlmH [Robertkochia aurantiaca]|uniref:23S rRNA (pseudouridine(1915)-N(3))-methyltransferase RlmH n=1 Tax=Robertkochia aurantiaca TaxID=2873700 RepID=UPI001CC926AA|nr:23S rRNA (pseudouridine(1915)-N(3))-methyltransferase RlmH [Robertkochia sp. 3YJGBD-33]